jgi:hypothetical protein
MGAVRTKSKSRQSAWKVKQFRAGNCITCGQSRGNSPYKRRCVKCVVEERIRHQNKFILDNHQEGKRGRPPLVKIRLKRKQSGSTS